MNSVQHLLAAGGVLSSLPAADQQVLTGREFFPQLISGPFHDGLSVVLLVAVALSALAGVASLLRGGRYAAPAAAGGDLPEPTLRTRPAAGDILPERDNTPAKEELDGPDHTGHQAGPRRD